MATTDYDAPRRSTVEDAETESLNAIKTARAEAQPRTLTWTRATLRRASSCRCGPVREELTMVAIPKQADEFTCTSCFLVQHRGRIASRPGEPPMCADCA